MTTPPAGPADPAAAEAARLAALHDLDILDTLPEREYDDLVALATAVCGTPVGLVSLVDRDRQWFKSKVGLDLTETPVEQSFCRHAIGQADVSTVFEVADASVDPRFAANPLVTGDLHLRFYAGVPLVMADGHAMGSLCVIDDHARTLTPEQHKALRTIARGVVARLELHRQNQRLRRENASLGQGPLQLLLDSTGEGIYCVDMAGHCTFANRAAARLLGYDRADLLGRHMHGLIHHHHRDGSPYPVGDCPAYQTHRTGTACRVDTEVFFRRDGSTFPAEYAAFPITAAPGAAATGTVVMFTDVTARKAAEAQAESTRAELDGQNRRLRAQALALAEGERRLRAIMDHSKAMIFAKDRHGRVLFMNREGALRHGRPEAELVGRTVDGVLPPALAAAAARNDARVWDTGVAHVYDERVPVPGGGEIHVFGSLFPLTDEAGQMTALCGVLTDISEQTAAAAALQVAKEAAERMGAVAEAARAEAEHARAELDRQNHTLRDQADALAEGELRLRSILDNSQAVIFAKDRRGGFLFVNNEYAARLGRPQAELLGLTSADIYPPAVAERLMAHDEQVWRTGRAQSFEERVLIRGVETVVVSTRFPLTNAAGRMTAVCGISADITARKAAEAAVEAARAELDRQNRQLREQAVALRKQAAALAEGELRLRSILDNSTNLIYAKDRGGRFLFVNRACVTLVGRREADLVGRTSRDLYPGAGADDIVDHDELVWQTGAAHAFEERLVIGGRPVCVVSSRFPLTDAAGRMTAVCGISTDITDRLAAEAELRAAKDAAEMLGAEAQLARTAADEARGIAEAASVAKSEFLANMSHEIRTPLNGVIGMAELLLGTDMSAQQARFTAVLRTSADALLGVINQVLDFSKIEAGKLELESTPLDLPAVVDGVASMLAHRAAAKGIALAVDVGPGVPRRVCGDPVRFQQILVNLVNNAIKFTDRGRVDVRVTADPCDGVADPATADPATVGHACLRFEVTDTGPGIPPDRLGRLFQSFSQVDASTTRRHGGTGLGLAISARLAKLMGGETGVRSTVGVGSTFWFTARVQAADPDQCSEAAPAEFPARPAATASAVDGLRVLVAEDNEVNQEVVAHLLGRWGCRATIVGDGRAAVDAVTAAPDGFDLILMDCQMPVLDGFAAAAEVRRLESVLARAGRPLPILALTASAIVGDRERCLAAGMNGYVTKPISPAELLTALTTLARPRGLRPAA